MPQAVVDPEELRRFAGLLRDFSNDLRSRMALLAGQMNALTQSWRDQEQIKFSEEFTEHLRGLARCIEVSEEHVPYLLRKAERIDEYLQQR
jgi:uncharacterized protein YukE